MNRRAFLNSLLTAAAAAAIPTKFLAHELCRCGKHRVGSISKEDKEALLRRLLDNAIESHDRLIEEEIFRASI